MVALFELAMVATAVLVCRHLGRDDLMWPAIGVALSLHFVPLGALFQVPAYYATATVGLLISGTALIAPLGSSRLIWLGAGMSLTMWASALYLVFRGSAMASRAVGVGRPSPPDRP
jgi:hypothetical protein